MIDDMRLDSWNWQQKNQNDYRSAATRNANELSNV